MVMLERARANGVRFISGRAEAVDCTGGRVSAVRISTGDGTETIATPGGDNQRNTLGHSFAVLFFSFRTPAARG